MTFQELGLNEPILRALADQGYEQPSPIQAKPFPRADRPGRAGLRPDRHRKDLRLRRPHSPAA